MNLLRCHVSAIERLNQQRAADGRNGSVDEIVALTMSNEVLIGALSIVCAIAAESGISAG